LPVIDATQNSGVSVWDITVRSGNPLTGTDKPGRVFVDYLAQITGGNGAGYLVYSPLYAVTIDGYVYRIDMNGLDPNGYIFYGNRVGYLGPDHKTPLYHDVVYPDNTLSSPAGGVLLSPATAKIFFNDPRSASDLPASILPTPITPSINNVAYNGSAYGNTGYQPVGGTFTYTGNVGGISEIIISRDGVDFTPDLPTNRRVLSESYLGSNSIIWDGKDNQGNYFPVGNNYLYKVLFHAGEYHFPLLDAENSPNGGPEITLLNPLGGVCPFNINCHTAFYDDRGYRVSTGVEVGTVGVTLPGDANGVNPPATNHSDQTNGFDTSSSQRAFGNGTGNGFGNWKALDLWTYFPVTAIQDSLNVINPPGCSPSPIATWDFGSSNTNPSTNNTDGTPTITSVSVTGPGFTAGGNPDPGISYTNWPNPFDSAFYVQFKLSTEGFYQLGASFHTSRNDINGPASLSFFYSSDGSTFTQDGSTHGVSTVWANYSHDLSLKTSLNNDANTAFRFVAFEGSSTSSALRLDNVTITGCQFSSGLSLTKSANPTTFTAAGQTIAYTFTLTNSGLTPLLAPFAVNDPEITVFCPNVNTVGDLDSVLDRGESLPCTGTRNITAGDVSAGLHTNTATASAFFGGSSVTSNTASSTVTLLRTPTITTAIHDASHGVVTSVDVGSTVHDSVYITGSGATPTGPVTFSYFTNGTCTAPAAGTSSTFTLSGGTVDGTTFTQTPAIVGSYSFQATYSGDANYLSGTSLCELLTVGKASPSITTTASPASGTVGVAVTPGDNAVMTGYNPTGSVTLTLYSDGSCTTSVMSGSGTIRGGAASWALLSPWTPTAVGTYYWKASYAGDSNNNGFTTTCGTSGPANEQIVIGKASATLTTTATGSVTVGANITDTAHLGGGYTPTGTITYDVFAPGDTTCSTPISVGTGKSVSGAGDYTSDGYTTTSAGDYRWIAHYSGDANNNTVSTACNDAGETSTAGKASPTIGTIPGSGGSIGVTLTDTATLTGGYNPTGSVTFKLFPPTDATCSGVAAYTYTDGTAPFAAPGFASNAVGTWHWTADYSGDPNNNATSSACADETAVVTTATLTIGTTLSSSSISVGGSVSDSSGLTGATSDAGGTVTYTVYTNSLCTLGAQSAGTKAVTAGVVPDSDSLTFNSAGTYYWKAVYSGDLNNDPASSTCTDETLTVGTLSPTITTSIYDETNEKSDVTLVDTGVTVHDLATVSINAVGLPAPTGTVSFSFYSTIDCTGAMSVDLDHALVGGVAQSTSHGPLTAGAYSFLTHYNGDVNYSTADSACEPLTVSAQGLFDPPFGMKSVDAAGLPVLTWTMVWINNQNHVPIVAAVHDPIPSGSTYVVGSLVCTPSGISSTVPVPPSIDGCYFEAPSGTYPLGRIVWTGVISDDFGATNAATALNEMTITFQVTVDEGIKRVSNTATIDSDLNGNGNTTDPGEQRVFTARASWGEPTIPSTGFAPGQPTVLTALQEEYKGFGDFNLEVPSLGINVPIVGVPEVSRIWDVSWLGQEAGWLAGSAFPTWNGNSVLTAHVYDAFGKPGPFVNVSKLTWGDKVIIDAWGTQYTYEVREVLQVNPDDVSAMMKHQTSPWLTLVTCRDYDESLDSYLYRVLIRAVLVGVK
jgi:LPXTG-site transpeptidase (sortase) family protein